MDELVDGVSDIPGVDVKACLARLRGKHKLFVKIIKVFMIDQDNATAKINDAVANDRMDEAIRFAHTLKGASANISAIEVSEKASRIEQDLKAGDVSNLPINLSSLDGALSVVMDGIKIFCENLNNIDSSVVVNQLGDTLNWNLLSSFEENLNQDLGRAQSIIEQLMSQQCSIDQKKLLTEINSAFSSFDFGHCSELVNQLRETKSR
jgi:two-component system sensor histidine kinase/response regulator